MVEVVNRQDHGSRKQEKLARARRKTKVMYWKLEVASPMGMIDAEKEARERRSPLTVISLRSRLRAPPLYNRPSRPAEYCFTMRTKINVA